MSAGTADARARIADVRLWYHTVEVAPGVVTPGWFDLRPIVDTIPWPDLAGKRCLDLATYDGFFAFEMERRGAAEVVATDIPEHADWDWLPAERTDGLAIADDFAGQKGHGFEVAHELLGSRVERRLVNIYDLDPAELGTFDVVVLGALLLHLRDPFRALEAVRRVCDGVFVSVEQVDRVTTAVLPRRPVMFVDGRRQRWTVPNTAGHRRMLEVSGFDVEAASTLTEPYGHGHPLSQPDPARRRPSARVRRLVRNVQFGDGIACQAIRARPRP